MTEVIILTPSIQIWDNDRKRMTEIKKRLNFKNGWREKPRK